MNHCTIYLLKNTVNDKIYVGQTWLSLKDRWMCGHGYQGCIHLHNAIIKYGKDKFYYEPLCMTTSQEDADYLEIYFINEFKNRSYNIRGGGSRGKLSEESKIKLSQSHKEWHKNNPGALKGDKNPMFGKILTKEQLKKWSDVKMGELNSFYGKHHTDESKFKISKSKRKFSEEVESQILEEYISGNISMQKLASKYNVSVKVIFNIANRGLDGKLHKGRRYKRSAGNG